MEDNAVYWFSAEEETACCDRIRTILNGYGSERSKMRYTVRADRDP